MSPTFRDPKLPTEIAKHSFGLSLLARSPEIAHARADALRGHDIRQLQEQLAAPTQSKRGIGPQQRDSKQPKAVSISPLRRDLHSQANKPSVGCGMPSQAQSAMQSTTQSFSAGHTML
jgi:hypothetical protein